MAIITPQTDLVLLQCPLEPDQQNQLTFASATAQYNYFNGLQKIPVDDFTYQRKDGTIRFPAHIDDVRTYNYCMYRNDAYSNKWFYAFITNMEYANDGVTMITIETDVWQTWQFDLTFRRSFVEREHTNNDAIGANTLDEGLSVGDPIINAYQQEIIASNSSETQRIVMQVTELPDNVVNNMDLQDTYRVYNGIPQGCYFCVFASLTYMQNMVRWYDKNDKANAILAIFLVPSVMVNSAHYKSYTVFNTGDTQIGFLPASYNATLISGPGVTYSATLDGYTPKNKKLYCYPYSYLYVSNNAGSDIIYRYEDFADPTTPAFMIRGTIGQGCNIQAWPYNYKRSTGGADYPTYGSYGISCAKLPLLSWTSDYYLNWQAQNGVNNVIQATLGVVSGVGTAAGGLMNVATASTDTGVGHGIMQTVQGGVDVLRTITSALHEDYVASLVPEQAKGNTNCGDLTYSMGKCGFIFRKMSCRREYAEMIDNYFSMFGYKTNKLKIPNITGRSNWNFVKTRICNVIGNIPQGDIEQIKDIFNSGITLWHNPATYLDYSQNNTIVQ